MRNKIVIGVVGMPGSGKSVVDSVSEQLGFSIVIMGDIIRKEVVKRGLRLTQENISKIMLQIRTEEGSDIVAKKCIPKIKNAKNQGIIIDGIRSLEEVQIFRSLFPKFKLLSIYSSPKTRFQRLFNRRRSDDPLNRKVFEDRDLKELKVGIGSVIAIADYLISNEESLRQFKTRVRRFLKASLNE